MRRLLAFLRSVQHWLWWLAWCALVGMVLLAACAHATDIPAEACYEWYRTAANEASVLELDYANGRPDGWRNAAGDSGSFAVRGSTLVLAVETRSFHSLATGVVVPEWSGWWSAPTRLLLLDTTWQSDWSCRE